MVLPALGSNGAGVRLRVAGIPVRFDTWFFVIGVVLSLRGGWAVVVLWLVVLGGSVLVHEMGHALVARTTGAEPHIVIHAMGGYTSWLPPGEVSRARRVAISLAGPAAGIALGLLFVAAQRAGLEDRGELARIAIYLGIRVSIFYGLFSLLPILPLDGGQTLRDLLPGSAAGRERTAAIVSVVVGAAAIAGALVLREPVAAVFVAFFVVGNIVSLSAGRTRQRPAQPAGPLADATRLRAAGDLAGAADAAERAAASADGRGDSAAVLAAVQFAATARLDAGDAAGAKRLLLDLPAGSVDRLLEGRVLLATGHPALGIERLEAALAAALAAARGADPAAYQPAAYHLAAGLVQTGALERVIETFGDQRLPVDGVIAAARGALDAGAPAAGGRLAELAGGRVAGRPEASAEFALAAFTAARAWARAGDRERSLLALRAAVESDQRYAAAAAGDDAFGSVRGSDYDAIVNTGR